MSIEKTKWIMIMLVVQCMVVLLNIVVTVSVVPVQATRTTLPCGALPIHFIMEHPHCADHLLKSMNITNVHVQPFNESTLARPNPVENTRYKVPGRGN